MISIWILDRAALLVEAAVSHAADHCPRRIQEADEDAEISSDDDGDDGDDNDDDGSWTGRRRKDDLSPSGSFRSTDSLVLAPRL